MAGYCATAWLLNLSGGRSIVYCCTRSGANPSPGHSPEGRVDFTKSSCCALSVLCCRCQMCWVLVILGIHFPSQPETGKHSCAPHCWARLWVGNGRSALFPDHRHALISDPLTGNLPTNSVPCSDPGRSSLNCMPDLWCTHCKICWGQSEWLKNKVQGACSELECCSFAVVPLNPGGSRLLTVLLLLDDASPFLLSSTFSLPSPWQERLLGS